MRRIGWVLVGYLLASLVGSLLIGWLIRRGRNSWDDYESYFPQWRLAADDWDGR